MKKQKDKEREKIIEELTLEGYDPATIQKIAASDLGGVRTLGREVDDFYMNKMMGTQKQIA